MHLLANCWHELEGAGQTAMQARKLDRAEDVSWNPPVLSFTIERHGMSTDHRCNSAHGRLVPGEGYQQTVADRRRRFRKQLTERMQTIGWGLLSVQRSMTFRKI
jgi:hypothetical protein